MAPTTIPTSEPTNPIAGDTWRWDKAVAGYLPSAGWTLSYALAGPKKTLAFTGAANAAGTGWEITVASTATLGLPAGQYTWRAYVEKAGERYTVERGTFVVLPDVRTATAGSLLSFEERMLPILEAAISGTLDGQYSEMQLEGRALKSFSLVELEQLRGQYAQIVQARRGGGRLAPVRVTFR